MNQYLTVSRHKGQIYSREIDQDTKEIHLKKISQYPFRFFGPSKEITGWTDVKGHPLKEVTANSISEFQKKITTVQEYGYKLYGTDKLNYQYIYEEFKGCEPKNHLVTAGYFDIETSRDAETGYSSANDALNAVLSISLIIRNKPYYWAMMDLSQEFCTKHDLEFFWFRTEKEMIIHFFDFIRKSDISILSGWNIVQYDIPYLMHRAVNLDIDYKKISPFGQVDKRTFKDNFNNEVTTYTIHGIEILDYLDLYKKFTYITRDNYQLNTIATAELNEKKVDYSETRNLQELYETDFYKFTEYNIKDSFLVKRLDDKLKLIDLCKTIAYSANVNFSDALGTVKMWQFYLYKELMNKFIVPPMKSMFHSDKGIIGAFVKDPLTGIHEWIMSFDLASLYPHNQMGCNISPDMLLDDSELPEELLAFRQSIWNEYKTLENIIDALSEKKIDTGILKVYNVSMSPNIQFYKRDKLGFIPEILKKIYSDRAVAKKKMLALKQELEDLKAAYPEF